MNLALRGIEAEFGPENADTYLHFDMTEPQNAERVAASRWRYGPFSLIRT